MPNLTQEKFDELLAAAAAAGAEAALKNAPAPKERSDTNRGAAWYPKEDGKKYALQGHVHPKCKHCGEETKFGIYLYDAGGDGVNKLPVFRLSLLEWKDKDSKES